MRLVLATVGTLALLALAACPAPKVPKGPPPEYEDPPSPAMRDRVEGRVEGRVEAGSPTDAGSPNAGD